jgi:hypothetical protein
VPYDPIDLCSVPDLRRRPFMLRCYTAHAGDLLPPNPPVRPVCFVSATGWSPFRPHRGGVRPDCWRCLCGAMAAHRNPSRSVSAIAPYPGSNRISEEHAEWIGLISIEARLGSGIAVGMHVSRNLFCLFRCSGTLFRHPSWWSAVYPLEAFANCRFRAAETRRNLRPREPGRTPFSHAALFLRAPRCAISHMGLLRLCCRYSTAPRIAGQPDDRRRSSTDLGTVAGPA